jgi:hypothetical protein
MTVIVTLKPTLHKDRDAMSRLLAVLETRLPATLPEIAYAFVTIQEAVKSNARAGLETTLRMGRSGGRVWAEVV